MSDTEADDGQFANEEQTANNDQSVYVDPEVEDLRSDEMGEVVVAIMDDSLELSTPLNGDDTKEMILEVKVTSKHSSHVGHIVGLVQNLISSERTATYGEKDKPPAGTLTTLPSTGNFPFLDGHEDTIPFFDGQADGQPLPEVGGSITLLLRDIPAYRVPYGSVSKDEGGPTIPLLSSKVDEKFIIYLYDKNSEKTIKQWSWGYSYSYDHAIQDEETGKGTGVVIDFRCDPPTEMEERQTPVLEGVNGATAGNTSTVHKWTDGLGHKDY